MADSKITALTAISTVDPTADPLVIVDVSDTSMAASGTTKKSTFNQLLGSGGTATLASATITGDLTVDTSTLKVNSSTNRVGILTASPESELDVRGLIAVRGTPTFPTTGVGPELFWSPGNSNSNLYSYNRATSAWVEMAYGALNHNFQISGVTAMTLNSTANLVLKGGTVGANGVGVTFPATQVASSDANCLDDYEEGTFTPTIVGTTTAGTGVYTTQQGRYTKIGNQVSVHIFLDWSAHTGTGNLKLAGLPFQSSNNFHACSIGFWNNIAVTAANVPMAYVINQETNVSLLQMPSGGGAMVAIPMDTAGAFVLSATYTV